jgi:GAF domain-containing protein
LDTLLQSLLELVPYTSAQILLLESDSRLFVAREAPQGEGKKQGANNPATFNASEFPLLQRVLMNQTGLVLSDTQREEKWCALKSSDSPRSWLCVPLIAFHQPLGLLSLGHSTPESFTQEHLRLTESLAIPAAAAIQNARLYECAKIFGTELKKSASDLLKAQTALQRFQSSRPS